ncbi:MAG: RNA methyltransferase [Clostridia bacterium]|nr:RNA methyltransferase [Clostridia bacterium]
MIISKQNSLIKQIRSLEDKKNRDKLGVYLAEGTKLVNDAILSGANVEVIVGVKNGLNAIKNLSNGSFRVEEVSEEVFKSITTEVSPQGALAVIKKPELEFSLPKSKSLLLDGVSDPSNVGAIIRTAAASGYKDVYLCETADPFNPKSVRASMGGVFKVNLYLVDREKFLNEINIPLIVADMNGTNVYETKIGENFCIVIGNEGRGVSQQIKEKATLTVSIPMENQMESLNASVSAGILMYLLKN